MEHCDGGELLKVVREGRRQGQADGCFRALGFGGYVPGLSMIQDMGRRLPLPLLLLQRFWVDGVGVWGLDHRYRCYCGHALAAGILTMVADRW